MNINWSTFILEMINFAILVWILQRFLYRPVLRAIEQRRRGIHEELAAAQRQREEAEALNVAYRDRLQAWELEKREARDRMLAELAVEQERLSADFRETLEQERTRERVIEQRRQDEVYRHNEQEALAHGGRFVASLLELLAGPELEQRLAAMFLTDLESLSAERLQEIRAALPEEDEEGWALQVRSAYPLAPDTQQQLQRALNHALGRPAPIRFSQDAGLIAGIQVDTGFWLLQANLKGEMKFFVEAAFRGA